MSKRKTGTCIICNTTRILHARGTCVACWHKERRASVKSAQEINKQHMAAMARRIVELEDELGKYKFETEIKGIVVPHAEPTSRYSQEVESCAGSITSEDFAPPRQMITLTVDITDEIDRLTANAQPLLREKILAKLTEQLGF